MGAIASRITGVPVVYSSICSGADQRKHQSFAPLAFLRGIHWWPMKSPHKGPVTRKMFPFDHVIMCIMDVRAITDAVKWESIVLIIGCGQYFNHQLDFKINQCCQRPLTQFTMRNTYLTASPTFPWQRALHKLGSVAVVWSKSFEILRWILRYNANCVHYHTPEFIDSRFSKSPCHTYMSFKYSYVTNIRSASWCCDDDVIKWKHFPRYWPFVRGIDRSPVGSPHKRPVARSFDVIYDLHLKKRLSDQSRRRWFEKPSHSLWRHCNHPEVSMQISICIQISIEKNDTIEVLCTARVNIQLQNYEMHSYGCIC